MKARMGVGTVLSVLLAFGVLRLFGMFAGAASPVEIAVGFALTAVYLMVFRAGVIRKAERFAVTGERVIKWEREKTALDAAINPAAA